LAILAKHQTEKKNAISDFSNFQSVMRLKKAAHSCAAGTAVSFSDSSDDVQSAE
jgi:hypothetical protein